MVLGQPGIRETELQHVGTVDALDGRAANLGPVDLDAVNPGEAEAWRRRGRGICKQAHVQRRLIAKRAHSGNNHAQRLRHRGNITVFLWRHSRCHMPPHPAHKGKPTRSTPASISPWLRVNLPHRLAAHDWRGRAGTNSSHGDSGRPHAAPGLAGPARQQGR